MAPLVLVVALAASSAFIPTTDPKKICQDARNADVSSTPEIGYQACVRDEQAARDEIRKNWGRFSADARANCSEQNAFSVSYVEVLTCLEMESGKNFSGQRAPDALQQPFIEPTAPAARKLKGD